MSTKIAEEPYVRVLRLQNRLLCLSFWEFFYPLVPVVLRPMVDEWLAQWRKEADELEQSMRAPPH